MQRVFLGTYANLKKARLIVWQKNVKKQNFVFYPTQFSHKV